ncbi:putative peptidase S54, rhomboid, Rhomboid-like superfamily [Dioscorea sansibarensis]
MATKIPSPPQPAEIQITIHPSDHPKPSLHQQHPLFTKWSPWMVPLFIFANIIMFIITMFFNNCPKNSSSCVGAHFLGRFSFQPLKENPLLGPSASMLERMGALQVNKVVYGNQGWRLLTCIWLHAGVFHILANMFGLLFIGIKLEQDFGFVRIGLLYLICGFGGSLMSALFIQSSISVGASGALFGLLGGMLSELLTNWTIYANKFAALSTLLLVIVINLAVGILPHVDNFAHIGGFLSGFFLGFVFLIRPQFGWIRQTTHPSGHNTVPAKPKHKLYQYVLCTIAAIILTVWFIVGLIMLFRGYNANEHCSWCHYLTCVPTKRWSCKVATNSHCLSSQGDNQLNLTCEDSGRSRSYILSNATDNQIKDLCRQFCS